MKPLVAFAIEHASRLTGATERQLRYWDQTGVFSPSYADGNRRRHYSYIYSFRDVVGLRTITLLRNVSRVSLQELRKTGQWLHEHFNEPWSELRFYVLGRRVYFDVPGTDITMAARPPLQTIISYDLKQIAEDMVTAEQCLRQRASGEIGMIRQHRYVAQNAPVLGGTRIPTLAVWNFHEAGYDTEGILREYPTLRPEDVIAAINFERDRQRKHTG